MSQTHQWRNHEKRDSNEPRSGETCGHSGAWPTGSAWEAGSSTGTAEQRTGTTRSASAAEAARSGLICGYWWERYPERLEYELGALKAAGIAYERDEEAFACGVMRLSLRLPLDSECFPLAVTFPDHYPYFRFQVEAPTLSLSHHQNPFGKNLCLIGRGSHHWHSTDTVAGLLGNQFEAVLKTGRSEDRKLAQALEQNQAEPFSDYYPYPPSMVVLPSAAVVPLSQEHGTFTLASGGAQGPSPPRFVRAALAEVRGSSQTQLFQAEPALLSAFRGPRLVGNWVRIKEPLREPRQDEFLRQILAQFPQASRAQANRVDGGWLQLWAVIFPEESRWRETDGEGWIVVCLFDKQRSGLVGGSQPPPWHVGSHAAKKAKKKHKRRCNR